ncbi:hypothetical protein BJY04DRAFT_200364 [Aspergillus karnatakaensis]|uniref:uncharacterized protein n=1 Tax=Aspergillus karnatakaensis TaxID=1810916 RepID=UPI003CCD2FA2
MKTHFIHPELWSESWEYSSYITPPPPIQQIHTLCHLYTTNTPNSSLPPLLKDTITSLSNRIHHPTTFTTLLSTTQALLLAQSMLLLTEDPATPYSESTSAMLYHIGHKLWAQAPIQLPNSLSPRKAWLMGETVRRTIIISFVLRSVYSMLKRGYSVRTPFIDALPFDLRTVLWDDVFAQWNGGLDEVEARDGTESMVSLYQYSAMLESGAVHGISEFGGLVLAACRGIGVEEVPFPSVKEYRCSSTIGVEPVKWH